MKNMYKQPFVGILNITTTSALCVSGATVEFKGSAADKTKKTL